MFLMVSSESKFNLSKIPYSVYRWMVKDSDHLSKYLKSEYPSTFSPIKFLHYTVACKYY